MFVNLLVFVAAIILEVLGAYMAVVGLSSKNSLILVIFAISLDFAKVVIASVIYKYWKELHSLFKVFLIPTLLFLMTITSYGSYAFLLQEFSKTTLTQEQIISKLESLEKESQKLTARKQDIDQQIATVNPTYISQKKRLTDMFAKELTQVNERLVSLDKEIPETKELMLKNQTETGTLMALAKSWETTPAQTAKIIALMMVAVLDPLAIVLLMVGNFLIERRREEKLLKLAKKEEEREKKERKDLLLKQAMEEKEKEKEKEKEVLPQVNENNLQKTVTTLLAEDKVEEKLAEPQNSVPSIPSYKFKASNLSGIQSHFIAPIASIDSAIVESGNQENKVQEQNIEIPSPKDTPYFDVLENQLQDFNKETNEQLLGKTESLPKNDNVNINEEKLETMENNSTEQLIENISNESTQVEVQEVPESTSLYNEENTYVGIDDVIRSEDSETAEEHIMDMDSFINLEEKTEPTESLEDNLGKKAKNVWQKTAPTLDITRIKEQMENKEHVKKLHNSWNKEDPFHPENSNLQNILGELDYLTPEVKESDKKVNE